MLPEPVNHTTKPGNHTQIALAPQKPAPLLPPWITVAHTKAREYQLFRKLWGSHSMGKKRRKIQWAEARANRLCQKSKGSFFFVFVFYPFIQKYFV